jgi:hypothetical protein
MEKNRWLIKTIEKKLNLALSLSLQMHFKLDFIVQVFWNRIIHAISFNKLKNPE